MKRYNTHRRFQDWATTYAAMDAADAAAIMQEMTGDTDIVSKILLCMKAKQRAAILAEMDPVYAGKLHKDNVSLTVRDN